VLESTDSTTRGEDELRSAQESNDISQYGESFRMLSH